MNTKKDVDISGLKTVDETIMELEMDVEGTVHSACIMQEVSFSEGTERWQIYNDEDTYDELFDLTTILVDGESYVVEID